MRMPWKYLFFGLGLLVSWKTYNYAFAMNCQKKDEDQVMVARIKEAAARQVPFDRAEEFVGKRAIYKVQEKGRWAFAKAQQGLENDPWENQQRPDVSEAKSILIWERPVESTVVRVVGIVVTKNDDFLWFFAIMPEPR